MRGRGVRRVHGARRRDARERVPGAGRSRRTRARDDDRGARRASSAPARVRRARRRAMRDLYSRHDHGGDRARQEADARRDACRPGGEPVSLHRLLGDLPINRGCHETCQERRHERCHERQKPRRTQRSRSEENSIFKNDKPTKNANCWEKRVMETRHGVCIHLPRGERGQQAQRAHGADHRSRDRCISCPRARPARVCIRSMFVVFPNEVLNCELRVLCG
jgi:hypothetical protein